MPLSEDTTLTFSPPEPSTAVSFTSTTTTATTTAATVAETSSATTSEHSARRHPPKRRYPISAIKQNTAEVIVEAAKSQKNFYEAKLQMAKEEHGAKMRILALKEQLLRKQMEE